MDGEGLGNGAPLFCEKACIFMAAMHVSVTMNAILEGV
jgi:hypothetical protein